MYRQHLSDASSLSPLLDTFYGLVMSVAVSAQCCVLEIDKISARWHQSQLNQTKWIQLMCIIDYIKVNSFIGTQHTVVWSGAEETDTPLTAEVSILSNYGSNLC